MPNGEILINQLFAGEYLSEGGNIGHEVINLFEDDDGERYLYITPSGTVKDHEVEAVIFVRNIHARTTVEVIAVGLGLTPVPYDDARDIRYAGVPLSHIFRSNIYHGKQEGPFAGNVGYKADRVLVPSGGRRVLLTIDPGFDLSSWESSLLLESKSKVIIPQSMRLYCSLSNDPRAYEQLHGLVSDESLWERADVADDLIADSSTSSFEPTFLEIVGKENDELVFSNLLAHYFDYNHAAFKDFASEENLLGIKDMDIDFIIQREHEHIDIWVESSNHVIVIENKIKSGINGLDSKGKTQLDKYRLKAEKYASDNNKKVHYYVFVPDYSSIDFSRYDPEGFYKAIPYSSLYGFFSQRCASYIADRYFPEFLRGLERHSMTMSELNYKTMRARFMRKIAEAR